MFLHELQNAEELVVDGACQPGEYFHSQGFDYLSETDLTASGVFSPENVGVIEFTAALAAVIHAAEDMDKFKKALFRQRTREESGLDLQMQPGDITLAQAFAHLNVEPGDIDDLFHGIVGGITEIGELGEVLLHFLDRDQQPDVVNVREEVGDVLWYLSRLVKWCKTSFLTEMRRNVEKLRKRHGTAGFNKEADINRNLAEERTLLETDATVGTVTGDPHSEDDAAS